MSEILLKLFKDDTKLERRLEIRRKQLNSRGEVGRRGGALFLIRRLSAQALHNRPPHGQPAPMD